MKVSLNRETAQILRRYSVASALLNWAESSL
jgi:hypothetical protein